MRAQHLDKAYVVAGKTLPVLEDFSLIVPTDTITALVGPSGCGKTTFLRLVGELEQPDRGSITKNGKEEGPISYLFQEPRLLPWHTVLANVELVLRPFGADHHERTAKAMEFIELVGLADYAKFKPEQLSGGMRQRVAIARAFAYPGRMMLLDEPFQSLDSSLRWSLVKAFLRLWEADKRTTVYVTHDVQEAVLMADTVIRLSSRPMRIIERHDIDTPRNDRSLGDPAFIALQAAFYT